MAQQPPRQTPALTIGRRTAGLRTTQPFRPLPLPTGQPPYRLNLETVLGADRVAAITAAGRLALHIVGDTGGVKSPEPQQIVAMHMEDDFSSADAATHPAFFFHLGAVVYYYGEAKEYYGQFYEPYSHYPAPIIAIPGNHDGDIQDPSVPSLAAFVENFCAATPHHSSEAGDTARETMTQPHVYFTLEAPFLTIVGLYTNVPEHGRLDDKQIAWFHAELAAAPTDKALIVAMHHPIHSLDAHHGSSDYMGQMLDAAIRETGRTPDAVFAAHVHNYQRFTRSTGGRNIPYIVAGGGGYWNLHYMAKDYGYPIPLPLAVPGTDVTLESYMDNRHGYMRLEVTAQSLTGDYYTVPRPQEPWGNPAERLDSFTLDLKSHRLAGSPGASPTPTPSTSHGATSTPPASKPSPPTETAPDSAAKRPKGSRRKKSS